MGKKKDRIEAFLPNFFGVEIEGIQCAKFFTCEGLEAETYVYEVEEGGLNVIHKFLGRTRFPNLILENGITENKDLYQWYHTTVLTEEPVQRKDGSIILYSTANKELKRWNFFRALPCRWIGPKLGKDIRGCAVERIEITHEGLELVK